MNTPKNLHELQMGLQNILQSIDSKLTTENQGANIEFVPKKPNNPVIGSLYAGWLRNHNCNVVITEFKNGEIVLDATYFLNKTTSNHAREEYKSLQAFWESRGVLVALLLKPLL